jgi:hypothetical protein
LICCCVRCFCEGLKNLWLYDCPNLTNGGLQQLTTLTKLTQLEATDCDTYFPHLEPAGPELIEQEWAEFEAEGREQVSLMSDYWNKVGPQRCGARADVLLICIQGCMQNNNNNSCSFSLLWPPLDEVRRAACRVQYRGAGALNSSQD